MKNEKGIKNVLIQLMEELPEDKIVARYISCQYTAKGMKEEAEKGSEIAKQYWSDLLRISRDLLARRTVRESEQKQGD